jgi:hypothetical protein
MIRSMLRKSSLHRIAFAAALLASPMASAQQLVIGGAAQVSSGVEGGGGRAGTMQRAPTRIRIGGDVAIDESPENAVGGGVVIATEPRAAFGLDLRYSRIVREKFSFSAGGVAYLQPGSLVGPMAAMEVRFPIAKEFFVTTGPELNVFVFGTDLPDRTVLWQAIFHVGLRVSL